MNDKDQWNFRFVLFDSNDLTSMKQVHSTVHVTNFRFTVSTVFVTLESESEIEGKWSFSWVCPIGIDVLCSSDTMR